MSMRKKKSLIVMICLSLLLAACGGGSGSGADGSTAGGEVIEIGYFNCDMMVACPVAYHAGIYEKYGLNVNLTMTSDIGVLMAAGQMDVGYMGSNAVNNALNQGTPIKMTAFNHLGGSYYLVGSNEIETVQDIVGKRVNMGPDIHDVNPEWRIIAHDAGIPYDPAEYEAYSMSQRDAFFALEIGELDGILVCDPFMSLAEHRGVGHELAVSRMLPDGDWGFKTLLIMHDDFMEGRPEEAEKILLAHVEAIQYLYTNPIESGKIFAEVFDVPEEVGFRTVYQKTVDEGRTMTWVIDDERVERYYDMTQKYFDMADWQDFTPQEEWVYHDLQNQLDLPDFDAFIAENVDPYYPVGMNYDDWLEKAMELYES
ncbi:NitT/TauT family transport system substrate-binding protein [Tindallia magadiensis]|uniref:NitT/TauT family transport system substrate-binding protein n=1 Tax=Tindallia magadiensis TaxID=69895 RepID=A0A1I3EM22_9FIRM|nr:ABC transporter substrate-binding subunit SaoX [Tindallia magadiensis]SFH99870.1 NitT/TauT family transport system substrate-binding protein [Tindallia magadiensis]